MGLTIHYAAQLNDPRSLPLLVAEVQDICASAHWTYTRIPVDDQEEHLDLRGIVVNLSRESEPLWLTFSSDGRLTTPLAYQMRDRFPDWAFQAFTKTQFAGPQTHIVLVHLLKYLAGKYFSSIQVNDEGQYWDTEDVGVLRERFETYQQVFNQVFDVLQTLPAVPGEPVTRLAERIEAALQGLTTGYSELRGRKGDAVE